MTKIHVPLNEDFSAARWADEFREAVAARDTDVLSMDRDFLEGWFANAIMCGHDHALRQEGKPVPMILWCPQCRARHIDEGEFETKEHHTHACQSCGMVWRPAVVPTVGVQFLPGFKNPEKHVCPRPTAPFQNEKWRCPDCSTDWRYCYVQGWRTERELIEDDNKYPGSHPDRPGGGR